MPAQAIPIPATNCDGVPRGPIQPPKRSMPNPTSAPSTSGKPSASAAVVPVSRRCRQASYGSRKMIAIATRNRSVVAAACAIASPRGQAMPLPLP